MLFFIHHIGSDAYMTIREKDTMWSAMYQKLTSRKFRDEKSVVKYAERLLEQSNLPDVIRARLKTFVDKHYNSTGLILDALDNSYNPRRK